MSTYQIHTMFDPKAARDMIARIEAIKPTAQKQWGEMNVSQMLAHCSAANEMASGFVKRPRRFIGRILGPFFKKILTNNAPYGHGNPTDPAFVMKDEKDFETEKKKLLGLVKGFAERGVAGASTHSHPFFGKISQEEWGIAQWKHLDHHLRQFSA